MTGDELRAIREKTGLSREKFAIELKVSASAVSAWENGVNKIKPIVEEAIRNLHKRLAK